MPIYDVHTHRPDARDAIINIAPGESMRPDGLYSVGIHPRCALEGLSEQELRRVAADRRVVAIGETGFDSLVDIPMEVQRRLFREHALLAEGLGKPMILHVVKRFDELLAARRELRPSVPWIVHGFRGKPETAQQLVNAGLYLSLGERFNPDVLRAVDPSRLLIETDESSLPISRIAEATGLGLRDVAPLFAVSK